MAKIRMKLLERAQDAMAALNPAERKALEVAGVGSRLRSMLGGGNSSLTDKTHAALKSVGFKHVGTSPASPERPGVEVHKFKHPGAHNWVRTHKALGDQGYKNSWDKDVSDNIDSYHHPDNHHIVVVGSPVGSVAYHAAPPKSRAS